MVRGTISKRTIERIISNLKKRNLIITKALHSNTWNRTNFFTINYEELEKLGEQYGSNVTAPDTAKMAESLQKNTTEENKQNIYTDMFEKFWATVPSKDGKKPAALAFKKAVKSISVDDLIIAYKAYIQVCEAQNRFKKNPSTWLNQECWNDESIQGAIRQLKAPTQPEQQTTVTPPPMIRKSYKGVNNG